MSSAVSFDPDGPSADDLAKASALIQHIRIALLTSVDPQGQLHSRPVQTLQVEAARTLWFFTDWNSPKVGELAQDARVSLGYADLESHTFVVVSGTGRLLRDPQKARELWSVEQRAYYPEGPEDARLALLRVEIDRVEYWVAPGRLSYLVAAANAALTGEPAKVIGENRRVEPSATQPSGDTGFADGEPNAARDTPQAPGECDIFDSLYSESRSPGESESPTKRAMDRNHHNDGDVASDADAPLELELTGDELCALRVPRAAPKAEQPSGPQETEAGAKATPPNAALTGRLSPRTSTRTLAISAAAMAAVTSALVYLALPPELPTVGPVTPTLAAVAPVMGSPAAVPANEPVPVRFANPFDASEVFEFPPGTSKADARDAVANLLLERARSRMHSHPSPPGQLAHGRRHGNSGTAREPVSARL